jgi:DNA polymerase-1
MKLNRFPDFSSNELAIDLETTELDPFIGKVLSVIINDKEDTWIFLDFWLEVHVQKLKNVLEDAAIVKIGHNLKFDYAWMKHHFNIEMQNMHDTFLVEKVVATDSSLPMSLDELIVRYEGELVSKDTRTTFIDHPGFADKPITNSQLEYMSNDVKYLHSIQKKQLVQVEKSDLQKVVKLEHDLLPAITSLELSGITLDVGLWHNQLEEFNERLEQLDKTMREIIKDDFVLHVPAKKKKQPIIKEISCENINLKSPQQLKQLFKERFNTEVESTAVATLQELSLRDGESKDFSSWLLEHRKFAKRIGFDYDKFVNPVTGRVHPSYHQLGARTGRFSCSKPNMQQVPRPHKGEPNMRHIWVADNKDYVIIRADYSQQEPRVMAQLCGDPAMIKACNEQDVYIEFGKHIFGKVIEKGSVERHIAKTFVLATGYGAGANKLSLVSGKTPKECYNIKNTIQKAFPVMAQYGKKMHGFSSIYGYVTTALGRKRYVSNYMESVNTPVQGTSADMFKLALLYVHNKLTELKKDGKIDLNTRVWNLVHDEIEVHCHKDEVDFILPLVVNLMEKAGKELCPDVLHIAEAEFDYRWDK